MGQDTFLDKVLRINEGKTRREQVVSVLKWVCIEKTSLERGYMELRKDTPESFMQEWIRTMTGRRKPAIFVRPRQKNASVWAYYDVDLPPEVQDELKEKLPKYAGPKTRVSVSSRTVFMARAKMGRLYSIIRLIFKVRTQVAKMAVT